MADEIKLPSGQTYKDFQVSATDAQKGSKEYGKIVAEHVTKLAFGNDGGYVGARNARIAINRAWQTGKVDIYAMFADKLGFNNQENYLNINWKALTIIQTIVSRLVGRWMERNEKISVTATDTLSITQKNEQYEAIEFELRNREKIKALEEATGVPITPQNQFRPDDMEELELWRQELQKLPEEILYQTNSNDAFSANGWDDVNKESALTDCAVAGFVGTYTWMDEQGVIHVDPVAPENAVYSYSRYPDFRDSAIRGQVKTLKITELRRKYGKQFNPNKKDALSEREIYEIAQGAKEYQSTDLTSWSSDWDFFAIRPYDDWNIDVLDFEAKTVDKEGYTITKLKDYGTTLVQKGQGKYTGNEPFVKSNTYVEDRYWIIYRGVYALKSKVMLEWGKKVNMIRPQDPKESGNCEFSYSFYMYQQKDMRNVAVPEKLEYAAEQLILACLKMEQCVVKSKPPGAQINVDALQEVPLGLGGKATNSPDEVKKLFDQTGDLYFRGKDADGKPLPVPIQEIPNAGFFTQMEGYIKTYQFYWSVLRDQLGEDPNLISQAVTPRVSQGNIQTAQQQGEYATDYMYQAYIRCMEETAKKMACLMHASVRYGSKAYRSIMGIEDIKYRVFGTKIRMLPTAFEIQNLKDMLDRAIVSTPDLVIYLDTFKVLRIAREDIKLAELYYRQAMKKMLISKQEQATRASQENAQIQIQAADAQNKGKAELENTKGAVKAQQASIDAIASTRNTTLAGIMELYKLSMQTQQPLPPELREISRVTLETVALPAMIENKQTLEQVRQKMQQDIAADEQMRQEELAQESQLTPPLPTEQPQVDQQPEMAA